MIVHEDSKKFSCDLCNQTFAKEDYLEHFKNHHIEKCVLSPKISAKKVTDKDQAIRSNKDQMLIRPSKALIRTLADPAHMSKKVRHHYLICSLFTAYLDNFVM